MSGLNWAKILSDKPPGEIVPTASVREQVEKVVAELTKERDQAREDAKTEAEIAAHRLADLKAVTAARDEYHAGIGQWMETTRKTMEERDALAAKLTVQAGLLEEAWTQLCRAYRLATQYDQDPQSFLRTAERIRMHVKPETKPDPLVLYGGTDVVDMRPVCDTCGLVDGVHRSGCTENGHQPVEDIWPPHPWVASQSGVRESRAKCDEAVSRAFAEEPARDSISAIFEGFAAWRAHNFGPIDPMRLLLGVAEEFGELAKAHGDEARGKPITDTQDAVGDTALYLMAYCIERGWSFRDCVALAWDQVKDRDYKRYPLTGRAALERPRG